MLCCCDGSVSRASVKLADPDLYETVVTTSRIGLSKFGSLDRGIAARDMS